MGKNPYRLYIFHARGYLCHSSVVGSGASPISAIRLTVTVFLSINLLQPSNRTFSIKAGEAGICSIPAALDREYLYQ